VEVGVTFTGEEVGHAVIIKRGVLVAVRVCVVDTVGHAVIT
jgi:hypothetical protein